MRLLVVMLRNCAVVSLALAFCLVTACAAPRSRCVKNSDCNRGSYCTALDGVCHMDCRNDFDCASGQACLTPIGQCVAGTGARLDGGVRDLRAPPADVDLATPVDEDMARLPPGAYGDVCHLDTDCATNICSRNPFATADHECTGDCNAGCRVGDFCAGGLTCAQSDIGKSCNLAGGGQDCRGGACLGGGNAAPFCTRVCQSAVECPAGYSCSSVQGGARVCLNVDVTPPCATDADCWYGTLCDNAGGHQRCLANCRAATDADCPLWHKCTNSNKGWLCVPNLAAGGGGIGAPCQSGDDCRAGACAGGTCLGACGVTSARGQWCPGGWGCNPVSTGNGWTLACVRAGGGSPGDACVDNSQCASGLCVTDNNNQRYCSRFCNSGPCPSTLANCQAAGVVADGVTLLSCGK